jgi:hypothetical protein
MPVFEIRYNGLVTYTMDHGTARRTIARLSREGIHATYRTISRDDIR